MWLCFIQYRFATSCGSRWSRCLEVWWGTNGLVDSARNHPISPLGPESQTFIHFCFWEKFIHLHVEDLNLRADNNWFWIVFDQKYHSPFSKHPQKSKDESSIFVFLIWKTNLRNFLWIYLVFTNFESLWSSLAKYMEVSLTWFRSICFQSKSEFKQITPTLEISWGEVETLIGFLRKITTVTFSWSAQHCLWCPLFFFSRLIFLKCEERKVCTSQTKFCQHLNSCSASQGKVSVDNRSSLPIYAIGNALEYFVFWSNISKILSRRRCRVFVFLILLHKIIWP